LKGENQQEHLGILKANFLRSNQEFHEFWDLYTSSNLPYSKTPSLSFLSLSAKSDFNAHFKQKDLQF